LRERAYTLAYQELSEVAIKLEDCRVNTPTSELMSDSRSQQTVAGLLERSAKTIGFDFFSFFWQSPNSNYGRPVVLDSYPSGWMSHYQDRQYYRVDPVLRSLPRTNRIRVWSEEYFGVAKPLWRDAQDAGLKFGLSQTMWCRYGVAVLSLARECEGVCAAEQQSVSMTAMWLANRAVQQVEQSDLVTQTRAHKLSQREKEVLRWTADGKNGGEVAKLLGISRRTVEFHVKNAIEKLHASNKAHAVSIVMQTNRG
tara:strand:+ start:1464 stop:2225 length:762 start_codon:yes stop_codon:yes gene_type:complete